MGEATAAETAPAATDDSYELAAQVELLADENRRLREEYVRARQSRYRSTALGLAAIGVVAVLGGILFPDAREVLVALGATGLFGALLTYYLTPGRVVAADVGERVYAAGAANAAAIADELGLRDERVYVPGGTAPARLYVPQHADAALPEERAGPIVVDDARGLLLEATGAELFREFERALTGDLAAEPTPLAAQLTDGLVEQFELARSAAPDVDAADGRATIAINDGAFGSIDRFDHPIPSFLAVGFAAGLDRPVRLEVAPGDDRADWLVTCRWGLEAKPDDGVDAAGDEERDEGTETNTGE
uniref:DUF7982 domain-containing protein n=1 Tax=Haloterrigena alkaliphila TaxID=2816475 RepID=A0A8A2VL03_9EURY